MDERFTALVRAHRVGLVGYLSRYVDVGTAEELAADAFVSLWQRLPVLRDENLRAYLYASGRNAARNYLRKMGRITSFAEMPVEMPAPDEDLDALLIRDERSRQSMRRWLILRPITAPCCICSILPVSLPLRPDRCWASRRNRWATSHTAPRRHSAGRWWHVASPMRMNYNLERKLNNYANRS